MSCVVLGTFPQQVHDKSYSSHVISEIKIVKPLAGNESDSEPLPAAESGHTHTHTHTHRHTHTHTHTHRQTDRQTDTHTHTHTHTDARAHTHKHKVRIQVEMFRACLKTPKKSEISFIGTWVVVSEAMLWSFTFKLICFTYSSLSNKHNFSAKKEKPKYFFPKSSKMVQS